MTVTLEDWALLSIKLSHDDDDSDTISQVKEFLRTNQSIALDPDWILVVKWIDVCPYRNRYCTSPVLLPNTFQAVIVHQSKVSYVIFTYKCGHLQWTDHNATIGYNADSEFFYNHPLSGTTLVTNVDCLNYPSSEWTNLVYKVSPFNVTVCDPPCVNGICTDYKECNCSEGWTGNICNEQNEGCDTERCEAKTLHFICHSFILRNITVPPHCNEYI